MPDDPIIDALNPMPKSDTEREKRIRARAFELWGEAGQPSGQEMHHWYAAEREIDEADRAVENTASLAIGAEPDPDLREIGAESPTEDGLETSDAPKMAGAPKPGADTSKSPLANRNLEGERKDGMTPRPTDKPIS